MLGNIKTFLFLDFETYYSQEYSLRKMTIPEYILDPQFEVNICAAAVDNAPSVIVDGPDFGDFISKFDPATTATVTFNSLFDNSILAWNYGWVPALMLDSMNMARALRGHILPKLNLAAVCEGVLGVVHDKSVIHLVKGMRRKDFDKIIPLTNDDPRLPLWTLYCDYANADNERSRDIFKKLIPEFPHSEMKIMDLVIRAAVQPRFMVDKEVLRQHANALHTKKIELLEKCGAKFIRQWQGTAILQEEIKSEVKRIGLTSSNGFKVALENLGVEVEMKPGKNGDIPAFAKTDQFMADLQEHSDSMVQALACARLGVKSTLEETRTEKFIKIASLAWNHYHDGNPRLYSGGEMPVALRYSGAHTHRLSGDWKLNMQNMTRGSMLRNSLIAPPGHVVVAGDLSQIEARLSAWLAGATALLEEFAKQGGDPYSSFASLIFGTPINRKWKLPNGMMPHFVHGFIGKTGVLGLCYQCADEKFFNMVEMLARVMGIDLATVIQWTPELAKKVVRTYRTKYWQLPQLWRRLQGIIQDVWSNPGATNVKMNVGPVTVSYGRIEGPNGLAMMYKNPRLDNNEYIYNYGYGAYKMYGGKMLENIIQFLARIIIMNAALRLNDLGLRFVLQAHDELVFIVPKESEEAAKALIYQELTRRPSWGKDIPLDAEVKSGPSYGDCK